LTRTFKYLIVLGGGVILGVASFVAYAADEPAAGAALTAEPEAVEEPSTTASPTITPSTTTTAPPTTTTEPEKGWLVIHGTGDVAVDPGYIPTLAQEGYDHAWSGLDGLFVEDDLTVINLECVPSNIGVPLAKDFVFRCPTETLPSIKANGIDVANMGNNHSGDFGKEALVDGRDNLIAAGIGAVGAGRDYDEAGEPALFEVNGVSVLIGVVTGIG